MLSSTVAAVLAHALNALGRNGLMRNRFYTEFDAPVKLSSE